MIKKKIPVSCNKDCGAGCPLTAHIQNGQIIKITDSLNKSEYTTGCPVGYHAHRLLYAKERLSRPLLRTGPKGSFEFKEIGWDEAYGLITEKMTALKCHYGADSLLKLGGTGSVHGALHNTNALTKRFLGLWGDFTDAIGSYSSQAASFVTPFFFGTKMCGTDPETLFHSQMIVLLGANISDTRFGSKLESIIKKVKATGTPVIVIDPRKTRSVQKLGTQWIPVFPGTDSAFLASVIYVLMTHNLIDHAYIKKYTKGFDELISYLSGEKDGISKTSDWAETICGIPSKTIENFAKAYATSRPSALIPGLSIQRTLGGEEAYRFAISLQAITGNIGKLGGTSGGKFHSALERPKCGAIAPLNSSQVTIDIYSYPDAVLKGKKGGYPSDIRMIYVAGGNLLSQGSDIQKNIRAFEKVEFSVCHDSFLTPTASYCDVVLPVSHFLERNDIVFGADNWLLFSQKAVPPLSGVKDDYEIFCELSRRLGFYDAFSEKKDEMEWLDHFLESSDVKDLDTFKKTGIFEGSETNRVAFSNFIRDPLKLPLKTPSGLIEISSCEYSKTGSPVHPAVSVMDRKMTYPLFLITPHSRYRIHSQSVNVPWFQKFDQQVLWIHPEDANKREIQNDQLVIVKSTQGKLRIKAWITEDIMEGVVSLYEGCWPNIIKGIETGGSVNILTSIKPTLPSHGSRTHSTCVEVEKSDV